MRIAYVYDAVYPWETGGVQKRVWEIGRRLADNHDVHWYGQHYWDGPAVIEKEGVTLHGVMEPREFYVDGRRSIPQALSFSIALFRPLLEGEFDIIDFQEFPFFPALPTKLGTTFRETTFVMTWHEMWDDYWYEYLGRLGVVGVAVERTIARLPDSHVAVSGRTRRELKGVGVDGATLIPNGVDLNAIGGIEPASTPVDIVYIGRIIPEKNVDKLVRAVARLRREGFGITVLEALAAGTPVVTADHERNAATELVIDGETGTICAPRPAALASAIRCVRNTVDGDVCRESVSPYDWDAIAQRTAKLYKELH